MEPLQSTLHVFTSQGGLSLLAQHMSLLYPDMAQQVQCIIESLWLGLYCMVKVIKLLLVTLEQ